MCGEFIAFTRIEGANQFVDYRLSIARQAFTGPAGARAAFAPEHTTAAGFQDTQADADRWLAVQAVLVLPLFHAAGHDVIKLLLTRPFQRTGEALVVIHQRLFALGAGWVDPRLQAVAAEHAEQDLLAALTGLRGLGVVDHRHDAPLRIARQVRAVFTGEAGAAGDEQHCQGQAQVTNCLHRFFSRRFCNQRPKRTP